MNNEIAFFLIMAISLVAVLFAGTQNKNWLFAMVVLLSVISSITAGKLITFFGFATSIATPIYAGIFLATDAISEIYGKKQARNAVFLGFFSNVLLIAIGQLIVNTPSIDVSLELSNSLSVIFNFIPKLVLAGLLAFVIAQTIDIEIFHFFKKYENSGKFIGKLGFRNNASTIVSQLFDSIIVYTIVFWALPKTQIIQLIITAWIIKVLVALFDTPFLYLIKKMRKDV